MSQSVPRHQFTSTLCTFIVSPRTEIKAVGYNFILGFTYLED